MIVTLLIGAQEEQARIFMAGNLHDLQGLEKARAAGKEKGASLPGGKVVLVIPDGTRSGTKYVGAIIKGIYEGIAQKAESVTALIALGTHKAMSEEAIFSTFGFTAEELKTFPKLQFANHEWQDQSKLRHIATFSREDMLRISGGRFDLSDVGHPDGFPIEVNYRVAEADAVVIIGPVLNHEVVGKSGGNKYFFPGTSGAKGTQFTHWLGACITIPGIIGIERTPVRDAIDFMASHITKPVKRCMALVLDATGELKDLCWGTPEEAHHEAAMKIDQYQTKFVDREYKTVVALLSPKYPEIWTGGKASYKTQGIVAEGGTLLIYAPGLHEVSASWGNFIEKVGYHSLPYIQARLPEYLSENIPLGVLAHVTHVTGVGTYQNGQETLRMKIVLASKLSEERCKAINLGYMDPNTFDLKNYENDPDTLVIQDAGEVLYRLKK